MWIFWLLQKRTFSKRAFHLCCFFLSFGPLCRVPLLRELFFTSWTSKFLRFIVQRQPWLLSDPFWLQNKLNSNTVASFMDFIFGVCKWFSFLLPIRWIARLTGWTNSLHCSVLSPWVNSLHFQKQNVSDWRQFTCVRLWDPCWVYVD